MMDSWTTLSRETVLDRGKFLRVEDHTVALPDGRVIEQWPWIITPDYVNVVAVTEDGRFICFCQVKYGLEGETLGARDPLYLQATTACLTAIIVMQVVNVFLCRSRRCCGPILFRLLECAPGLGQQSL